MDKADEAFINSVRSYLRGPRDYDEGLKLLKVVYGNTHLIQEMEKIGATEPGSMFYFEYKSRINFLLNVFLTPNRYRKREKPEIHIRIQAPHSNSPDADLLERARHWVYNGSKYSIGLELFGSISKNYKLLSRLTASPNRRRLVSELKHILITNGTIDPKLMALRKLYK